MPFVQGRLQDRPLTITVDTVCAHCSEAISFEMDDQLHWKVLKGGGQILIFQPFVDPTKVEDPSIIDAF